MTLTSSSCWPIVALLSVTGERCHETEFDSNNNKSRSNALSARGGVPQSVVVGIVTPLPRKGERCFTFQPESPVEGSGSIRGGPLGIPSSRMTMLGAWVRKTRARVRAVQSTVESLVKLGKDNAKPQRLRKPGTYTEVALAVHSTERIGVLCLRATNMPEVALTSSNTGTERTRMSYGEQILGRYFKLMLPEDEFLTNVRPGWLNGLELDFFFPSRQCAFEFQGDHHYINTPYSTNVRRVKVNDRDKRLLCRLNGVKLVTIDAADLEWTRLRRKLKNAGWKRHEIAFSDELAALNKEATAYRKLLVANFNSVTARRKGKSRKAAVAVGLGLNKRFAPARESVKPDCLDAAHTGGGI